MRLLFEINHNNFEKDWKVLEIHKTRAIICREGKYAVQLDKTGEYSFLGGGVEEGETLIEALKREVLEESGLVVKENTIREFAEVKEIKADRYEEDTIYISHNYYYFCEVDNILNPTSMTEHEKELGCRLAWENLDNIIEANNQLGIDNAIFRDNMVFKTLLNEYK